MRVARFEYVPAVVEDFGYERRVRQSSSVHSSAFLWPRLFFPSNFDELSHFYWTGSSSSSSSSSPRAARARDGGRASRRLRDSQAASAAGKDAAGGRPDSEGPTAAGKDAAGGRLSVEDAPGKKIPSSEQVFWHRILVDRAAAKLPADSLKQATKKPLHPPKKNSTSNPFFPIPTSLAQLPPFDLDPTQKQNQTTKQVGTNPTNNNDENN